MSFIPIQRLTGTISSELIDIDCLAINLKDLTCIQRLIFFLTAKWTHKSFLQTLVLLGIYKIKSSFPSFLENYSLGRFLLPSKSVNILIILLNHLYVVFYFVSSSTLLLYFCRHTLMMLCIISHLQCVCGWVANCMWLIKMKEIHPFFNKH